MGTGVQRIEKGTLSCQINRVDLTQVHEQGRERNACPHQLNPLVKPWGGRSIQPITQLEDVDPGQRKSLYTHKKSLPDC